MPVISRVSGGMRSVPPRTSICDGVGQLGGADDEDDTGGGGEQDEDDSEQDHASTVPKRSRRNLS